MKLNKFLQFFPEPFLSYIGKKYYYLRNLTNQFPFRSYTKRHKCIFIHIPKTAGTSILDCLVDGKINRDHATYYDYMRFDIHRFNKYYKFCFVRNPYDRSVSFYEYLKKGGNGVDDIYIAQLIGDNYKTFDDFVLNYLDKDRIHEHILFRPQYLFIYNFKEEIQVDFVGRYERLEIDFKVICNNLNLKRQLPNLNKTQRRNYKQYYSNDLVRDKIYYLYEKDFQYFNYPKTINLI